MNNFLRVYMYNVHSCRFHTEMAAIECPAVTQVPALVNSMRTGVFLSTLMEYPLDCREEPLENFLLDIKHRIDLHPNLAIQLSTSGLHILVTLERHLCQSVTCSI